LEEEKVVKRVNKLKEVVIIIWGGSIGGLITKILFYGFGVLLTFYLLTFLEDLLEEAL